ncbi:PEGA domain-containing protein [Myxococcus sp. K15C18031901]|uniref:PEGA domain-containing protein n=1 Tax=Myxococcus dinghuensis TaxID=2906761 RepID=UPI0020A75130|nr:PEGA domain-containing protein [Myxococcus dinghuensis]MCP3104870.1 PEGA domain-containing protein [Myxococcus dinghuensis]
MRPSSKRAVHAALSGWLVGMLAVGPAAAQGNLPLRLAPRAVTSAASASSVTVVAIPLDAASRTEAARLAYWAEQAVARSGRLELVRLSDALDADGQRAREAKAAAGAEAMKEGQKAYDELDTQKALEQFDAAAKDYEASDLSRAFGELSRARVMKAASQVANGESTAAQLEIRSILAADPRAQFSPNFFPPDDMAFVEKERKAALGGSTGTLTVTTEPVPAQVYVDGQFRGVSPVSLSGLTAADHYVTVMAPGFAVGQQRAREGDTALTLAPVASLRALQTVGDRVTRKPDAADRDVALRELGALAGVPQVLALLVSGGTGTAPLQVTALRIDVADGHNLAYAVGPVPRGDAMATGSEPLLTGLLATDTPRQAGKPVTHFAPAASSNRKTTGYVLMATGVALLAGGIYFGMEASSKEDDFHRAVQNSSRAKDIKDTGKTYALVADIGLLTGAVAAGLGSYFAFAGGGSGSSSRSTTRISAPPPEPKARPAATSTKPSPPAAKSDSLAMPPPPKGTKPLNDSLPMPPPPAKQTPAEPPPPAKQTPAEPPPPPAKSSQDARREDEARREEELRKRREEVERQRRELEERRKQEDAEAERQADATRKREEEAKRKREDEERRKKDEDKKRPSIDEDDLRNY